jgi:signal transduction histidine kinase
MLFYPAARVESRLVTSGIAPQMWRVEVSAPLMEREYLGGYWPTVFSVILMLGAFGLTVRANLRAAEVAQRQAEFMAHASHQLKTPLSLISAATETIEMAHVRSPDKLAQYLTIIRNEATRLSSLVQRILEFSRVEQARALEFEAVRLAPLVRETVEAFEQSLSARRFTFTVDVAGDPHVLADSAAIEQVLGNLLDNAVKYCQDAREIRVRVVATGTEARIEVIDQGPGIPRHDRERIFEKFYRGNGAANGAQGFGLGLPIVRELVLAHRGRVDVEDAPGHGSIFRVTLPAIHLDRAVANAVESPTVRSQVTP